MNPKSEIIEKSCNKLSQMKCRKNPYPAAKNGTKTAKIKSKILCYGKEKENKNLFCVEIKRKL